MCASLSGHSDGSFVPVFQLFVFNKESTRGSNKGYGPRTQRPGDVPGNVEVAAQRKQGAGLLGVEREVLPFLQAYSQKMFL